MLLRAISGFAMSAFITVADSGENYSDHSTFLDHVEVANTVLNFKGGRIIELRMAIQGNDEKSLKNLISSGLSEEELVHGLIAASASKRPDFLEQIVESGANVNAENGLAIILSSGYGCNGCVRVLLEHGANVHERNDEALFNAARFGKYHVVQMLLEAGADSSARGTGIIASAAREYGYNEVAELIERFENLDLRLRLLDRFPENN